MILLGCLVIYGDFLWGNNLYIYRDAGTDTIHQYVPYYIDMINEIKEGHFSFWNFDYGLGTSIFISQTWTFDPFNMILIAGGVLFGDSHVPTLLVIVQIVRLLAWGLLTDRILVFYCKRPPSRIIGSLLFVFSGYMIWETHYWFGTAAVSLCLLLLAFELLAHKRSRTRIALLSLSVTLSLLFSVYLGFMNLLFLIVYGLIRLVFIIDDLTVLKYMKQVLFFAVVIASGCLLSCVILLPVAQSLMIDSQRINDGTSLFDKIIVSMKTFCQADDISFYLSRFISNNLVLTGKDTGFHARFFDIQIGCSVFVFTAGLLYCRHAIKVRRSLKYRVLMLLPVLLIVLYCFNGFIPSMFNVFAATSYRNSYAMIFLIVTGIAYVIDKLIIPREAPVSILVVGAAIAAIVILISFAQATPRSKNICCIYLVLVLLAHAFLIVFQKRGISGFLNLALTIVVASSLFDSFLTVNYRLTYTDETSPISAAALDNNDTEQAIRLIKGNDDSLYRIEKTYCGSAVKWQDNWIHDYNGVTSYNSVLSRYVISFYKNLWPSANTGGESFYLQNFDRDWNYPGMLKFLGIRYVLSNTELSEEYLAPYARVDDIFVYKNTLDTSLCHVYGKTITQAALEELDMEQRRNQVGDKLIIPNDMAKLAPEVSESSGAMDLSMINEGELQGYVYADGQALVGVAIPYNTGWRVFIDGDKVETFQANYGFIGFEIPEGSHSVRLQYVPSGIELGAALSILGLALLIALLASNRRASRIIDGGCSKNPRKSIKMKQRRSVYAPQPRRCEK